MICSNQLIQAQNYPSRGNYDESKIGLFALPNLLVMQNGKKVKKPRHWKKKRRKEVLKLFKKEMYGVMPPSLKISSIVDKGTENDAINGKAKLIQKSIVLKKEGEKLKIDLCIFLPNSKRKKPYPVFLACNFFGNHTVSNEPSIIDTKVWTWRKPGKGGRSSKWAIEDIIDRGYGLVTYCYSDIDPDDGIKNGLHNLFPEYKEGTDNLTSIGAWAWGLSRVMDFLEDYDQVDSRKVAVMGHSRLGKTALWAGANDERFAIVISNNSGSGGASISRRNYGETIGMLNQINNGHWTSNKFKEYSGNEKALPIDQHMLISLIAPRPVYVASAEEDYWADPKGEFLSCIEADKVYKLLKTKGLPSYKYPKNEEPIIGQIGYHVRSGVHDVTKYDWKQYLNFADRFLK